MRGNGLFLLLFLPLFGWSQMSESAMRGQEIFRKGKSGVDESKITALMSGTSVPATVLPCASCHGVDGKGRPEGGVSPSNITWANLSKNYVGPRANGRQYPAYQKSTLKRAITMGLDPAGNPLNSVMPKYQMTQQQMQDLLAYIEVLGQEGITGVTDTTIQIGSLLRPDTILEALNEATSAVIEAYFAEINGEGGLYNRKLQLQFYGQDDPLVNDPPFALVNSWQEKESTVPEDMPLIGALGHWPPEQFIKNRSTFYLLPGLRQMARELGKQATADQVAVVYTDDPVRRSLLESFEEGITEAEEKKVLWLDINDYSVEGLVEILRKQEVKQLCLLVQPGVEKMISDAFTADDKWQQTMAKATELPELLLLGSYSTLNVYELPPVWEGKVLLVYPQWITTASEKGLAMMAYLQEKYGLSKRFPQSQWTALAGAILLVDGLKRVGRTLTRERLVEELEDTYQLNTGLLPPLSFSANRRIGSEKIFLVRYLGKENGLQPID